MAPGNPVMPRLCEGGVVGRIARIRPVDRLSSFFGCLGACPGEEFKSACSPVPEPVPGAWYSRQAHTKG